MHGVTIKMNGIFFPIEHKLLSALDMQKMSLFLNMYI